MLAIQAICAAITAVVIFEVLFEPGMIFGFWYQFLERLNVSAPWLAKPLGYCGKCFSGQIGFWFYLVEYRGEWQFFDHAFFTCATIFFFSTLGQWANKNGLR